LSSFSPKKFIGGAKWLQREDVAQSGDGVRVVGRSVADTPRNANEVRNGKSKSKIQGCRQEVQGTGKELSQLHEAATQKVTEGKHERRIDY